MARLRVRLFAGFEARLGSGRALVFRRRKAAALLAYLGMRPGRAHPRDALTALLWGGSSEEQARHSFRQTLYSLQQVLPKTQPPVLHIGRDDVTVDPTLVESDVATFERLVADGSPRAIEKASALYQGDLLAGIRIVEPAFEEWLRAERGRLRELARQALGTVLTEQERRRELARATQTAIRLLALDPLHESVHRTLMLLHARQGRRAAAVDQYRICAALLQRELGVAPEAETTAVYRQVISHPEPSARTTPSRRSVPRLVTSVPPPSGDTAMVGRREELIALRHVLDATMRGSGHVVAVTGEAGIGKSRLVEAVVAEARRRGARVLVGRNYELERLVTLRPWADAIRTGGLLEEPATIQSLPPAWRGELSRLFPELEDAGVVPIHTADAQGRLWEAVTRLIERVAATAPAVVVVEDLQWADESSVGLISFVAHRLARWPVMVIFTARDDELVDAPLVRRLLDDLAGEPHFLHRALRPLSETATADLVRSLAGRIAVGPEEAEDRARQVWAASRGNPFVIVELVRALADGHMPAHTGTVPIPERIARLVASRLDRLDAQARDIVSAAAIIGSRFRLPLVARAAEVDEGVAAKVVDDLLQRRIFHEVGSDLDFVHDWIRAVASHELSVSRKRYLHAAVARALIDLGAGTPLAHPGTLGVHYREAEEWPRAAAHFQQAGHEARVRGAVREAAAWFEQALSALARVADGDAARGTIVDIKMELAQTVLVLGELRRVGELYAEAEPLARAIGDRGRHSQALTGLASYAWYDGRFAEGVAKATEALEIAEALGDRERVVWAAFTLAQNRSYRGEMREAIRLIRPLVDGRDAAVSQAMRTAWGSMELICLGWLALWLASLGEFDVAVASADRCVELANASGLPQARAYAYFYAAQVNYLRGDIPMAGELLESAVEISRTEGLVMWSALCGVRYGQVVSELGRAGPDTLDGMRRSLALQEQIAHKGNRSASRTWWAAALLAHGRIAEARDEAQRAVDLARTDGKRVEEAYAVALLGRIAAAGAAADLETAATFFEQARTLAAELELRPLVARSHLGLGSVCRRIGRATDARAHLLAAVTMFRDMGMRRYVETAETELALTYDVSVRAGA